MKYDIYGWNQGEGWKSLGVKVSAKTREKAESLALKKLNRSAWNTMAMSKSMELLAEASCLVAK